MDKSEKASKLEGAKVFQEIKNNHSNWCGSGEYCRSDLIYYMVNKIDDLENKIKELENKK